MNTSTTELRVRRRETIDTTLILALIVIVLIWCVRIVWPFADLIAWGAIIAIAMHPVY